ncbi:MAG: outer membrane lipoprotein-sorting protein [Pseudomonadota bacterium]
MKTIATLLLLALSVPAFADAEFQKVYGCMRSNVPETIRAQEIEFNSTDRTGASRVLRGKLTAQRDNGLARISIRITAPANVAGAAYLVRERVGSPEDDMFVFLPGVGRVRHITGAFANGSLLGTDFSYTDAKLIQNTFTGSDGKLEAASEIDQRPVHVLTLTPTKKLKNPSYTLVRMWLDQKTCVPLKADFYQGTTLRKQLTASAGALTQSGKFWYLSQFEMSDLREGTKTQMKFGNVEGDVKATKAMFDPNGFYKGN